MNDSFRFSTPTDERILMSQDIDAPQASVFAAWTQPEHVTHWWDPTGRPLRRCEIDLRIGGHFDWVPSDGERDGHRFSGTYRAIDAPQRLVFSLDAGTPEPSATGTVVFEAVANRTFLVLTIDCTSRQERDRLLRMRIDAGTAKTLENLAQYVVSHHE